MVEVKQYKQLVYEIIGAAMRVHSEMNYGLLEAVYQECLAWELSQQGIANEIEKELLVFYRGHQLSKQYRMDLVVSDIVCELKSVKELSSAHRAQLCNYLRLTKKPLGLLINFGGESLIGERWAYDRETNECFLLDKSMERVFEESLDDFDDEDIN